MSWLTEPDEDWDEQEAPPRHDRWKVVAALLAGWLAVSLIVLIGLLRFGDRGAGKERASSPRTATGSTATSATATPSASAGTAGSSPAGAVPAGWVRRADDEQANCTAHSYGQVQVFFARTPCASVRRSLFSIERNGRSIVVATNAVTFTSEAQAADYLHLVTSDGTGNINDLLREGDRYPGSPSKLPPTAFASRQDGLRVLVAEAGYVQGRPEYRDPTLQAAARAAVDAG